MAEKDAAKTLTETPPTSTPAQSLPLPQDAQAALGATRARTRQEKPTLIDPSPAPEDAVLQGRCKEWYKRITEHCGGPMTKGGQVINEHRCVKMLCQKYDDRQLEAIFKYLTKRHWKWSKIDNRFNVRAFIVWDEACGVAQILREERQPTNEEDTPLLSVEEEFGRYWGINEKRGMSYATA